MSLTINTHRTAKPAPTKPVKTGGSGGSHGAPSLKPPTKATPSVNASAPKSNHSSGSPTNNNKPQASKNNDPIAASVATPKPKAVQLHDDVKAKVQVADSHAAKSAAALKSNNRAVAKTEATQATAALEDARKAAYALNVHAVTNNVPPRTYEEVNKSVDDITRRVIDVYRQAHGIDYTPREKTKPDAPAPPPPAPTPEPVPAPAPAPEPAPAPSPSSGGGSSRGGGSSYSGGGGGSSSGSSGSSYSGESSGSSESSGGGESSPAPSEGAVAAATDLLNAPVTSANGASQDAIANAKIVAEIAISLGLDPVLAVACMLTESGGNNRAIGDGGTSFGLFQLHKGGALPKEWYDTEDKFDPRKNAERALTNMAGAKDKYSGSLLAYKSQRPANQADYQRKVDGNMAKARQMLGM